MSRLYLDNGLLVWNGNEASGKENIQKYFLDLPSSIHNVITLDTQPIIDESTVYAPTFIIQVSGNVKFHENAPKPFQQSFMITAQGDKWKIATDCFRLQDALSLVEKKWKKEKKNFFYFGIYENLSNQLFYLLSKSGLNYKASEKIQLCFGSV